IEDVGRGSRPPHEHTTAGLIPPGASGGARGADGALVFPIAPATPIKSTISPPPCRHYLRLQILRSGANQGKAGRHNLLYFR
ncbi:hypothetical protein L9F63_015413, partial [Diploptera punctata]